MLGKMLIHGLVASAIIGSAAAVYAQAKDMPPAAPPAVTTKAAEQATSDAGNGYLRSPLSTVQAGRSDGDRTLKSDRHHDRKHDRKHDHDDDDD